MKPAVMKPTSMPAPRQHAGQDVVLVDEMVFECSDDMDQQQRDQDP